MSSQASPQSPSAGQQPTLFSYFKGSGRWALVGTGLAFLLSALPVIYGGILSKTTYEARRGVEFIFEGVEEKRYPSGMPFAIQDVTSPVVLQRTFDQLGLEGLGVKYADFRHAIVIEPYAETYNDRANAYRTRLGVEALEGPDIELIEEQMRADLSQLYNRSARLSFALAEYANISPELLDQVLVRVMENWARYSVNERGVIALPSRSGDVKILSMDQATQLSYPLIEDYLLASLSRLEQRAEQMAQIPGAASILPSTTGQHRTLADITAGIQNAQRFEVIPFVHTVLANGRAANWRVANSFFDQEKLRINLAIAELERTVTDLSDANNDYIAIDQNLRPVRGGIVRAEGASESLAGDYITLGDGFAERVFDIAETAGRHQFVQANLNKRLEAQAQIAQLQNRLARIEAFEKTAATSGNQTYSESDLMQLSALVSSINTLWGDLGVLEANLEEQRHLLPGHLYNLTGEDKSYSIHRPLWGSGNITLVIVLTILGALFGVMYAVVRRLGQTDNVPD